MVLLKTRLIKRVLPCIFIALACICLTGCLVGKSKYTRAQEQTTDCRQDFERCRADRAGLNQEAEGLRKNVHRLEDENQALLDDLADLGAEHEEMARQIANFKKELTDREQKIVRVTDTYKNLMEHLSQEIQDGKVRIDQGESRLRLNLVDKILFPSGSATLSRKGKEVLQKVGYALKDTKDRKIMIEGHTDDVPLSTQLRKTYPSNWDLSSIRASSVVRFLQEEVGIDPRLLSATGYSMYQPIVDNDTTANRQQNRRIEIVLIPLTPKELQKLYATEETPGTTPPLKLNGPNEVPISAAPSSP